LYSNKIFVEPIKTIAYYGWRSKRNPKTENGGHDVLGTNSDVGTPSKLVHHG
jgi:hypothetical protein